MSSSPPKRRGGLIGVGLVLLLLVAGAAFFLNRYPLNEVVTYDDPTEHFKYGSLGSDIENGLPTRVMQVLPVMFPEYLPPGSEPDWTAFGFIQEPGRPMPVGFSERVRFVSRTGLNCAACHTGAWRTSTDAEPEVILGMPAINVDLQAFFGFLFQTTEDPRFTTENVLAAMEQQGTPVSATDRLVYRYVIPGMRDGLAARKSALMQILYDGHPGFGPGRVDTFNPYKVIQLVDHYPEGIPEGETIGTAEFAAIWNLGPRKDMPLNWDGNAPSPHDRNIGAAFGAGATREGVDQAAIDRMAAFLDTLSAPDYPFPIDTALAAQGAPIFRQYCAECHSLNGSRIGTVVPIEQIGTDRHRMDSYSERLNQLLLDYGTGYDWKLTEMTSTNGYVNGPLDGIWARAPYLHNGSVPSLWDLLTPAAERNDGRSFFYTGHGVYDSTRVGIRPDVARLGERVSFRFDLTAPGNNNAGHTGPSYGTELTDREKRALIEYLKTL